MTSDPFNRYSQISIRFIKKLFTLRIRNLTQMFAAFLLLAKSADLLYGYVNTESGINVRNGPGTEYERIDGIAHYKLVQVIEDAGNNFYHIKYDSVDGYGSKDFIDVFKAEDKYSATITATGGLNIRAGPGTTYTQLFLAAYSTEVTVIGTIGEWCAMLIDGKLGYGHSDYVEISEKVYMNNKDLNKYVQKFGSAFLSLCYIGGIRNVKRINSMYTEAVSKGWIRGDCTIANWDACKGITGSYAFRYAGASEKPASKYKEILELHTENGVHYVVGNGNGGILYDPAGEDSQSDVSKCFNKRFYIYS